MVRGGETQGARGVLIAPLRPRLGSLDEFLVKRRDAASSGMPA
jgi:hypothetical protein